MGKNRGWGGEKGIGMVGPVWRIKVCRQPTDMLFILSGFIVFRSDIRQEITLISFDLMYRGEKAHQITFSILLPSPPLPSPPPTHSRRGNPNTESRYMVSPRLLSATFRLQMTSSFWCLKRTKAVKLIGHVIANLVHFSDTSKGDGFLLHLL